MFVFILYFSFLSMNITEENTIVFQSQKRNTYTSSQEFLRLLTKNKTFLGVN